MVEGNEFQWTQVQELCEKRAICRGEKRFSEADAVLQELHTMGVTICDGKGTWQHKESGSEGKIGTPQSKKLSVKVPPPLIRRDGDWDCPKCKNVNWASRVKCFVCGITRETDSTTVLPKRVQLQAEKQAVKDEQRACDEHYRRAQERLQEDAKLQAKQQENALAELARIKEAHPVPMVNSSSPLKSSRVVLNNIHKDEGPPQPKAGDASGLAALKRVREEVINKEKRPKTDNEEEVRKEEGKSVKKLSLDTLELGIKLKAPELVRNLKILTRVASSDPAKCAALRNNTKILVFLAEVPDYASSNKSSTTKEVVVISENIIKLIGSLISCKGDKKEQALLSQWVLESGTPHLEALAAVFRMNADGIKIAILKTLPGIFQGCGSGIHAKRVFNLFDSLGVTECLRLVRTADPKPIVMDAVRKCYSEIQKLNIPLGL